MQQSLLTATLPFASSKQCSAQLQPQLGAVPAQPLLTATELTRHSSLRLSSQPAYQLLSPTAGQHSKRRLQCMLCSHQPLNQLLLSLQGKMLQINPKPQQQASIQVSQRLHQAVLPYI